MRMTGFGKSALLFGVGAFVVSRISPETKTKVAAAVRGLSSDARKTVHDGVSKVKSFFDDPPPQHGPPPAGPQA